ncbi:SdrD B-like domain-containing protein [Sinosporangium album]|uniref:SdrD B-like domain-containing protein n=1 Tax=Sinosporangium album TaxID=504805 RepID=UPI00115FB0EC|nr:SdrD B-like domain-containing protein [Sinosporangium album]
MSVTALPAAAAEGPINVKVVRDVNSDGTYQASLELGVAGITVTAFDAAGRSATATTDASGTATISTANGGISGGQYRVEAVIPESLGYLKPAPAGGVAPALAPLVSFVNTSTGPANLVMGVHNPADYVQANPPLVTAVHTDQAFAAANPGHQAMVSWPRAQRGRTPAPAKVAGYGAIGTTYGHAWQRSSKTIFTGALAKRYTSYGPLGPGGVYAIGADGAVVPFATVPDAGTTQHGEPTRDKDFWDVPGKEGLGDLDVSGDDRTLYAVNLAARALVAYDIADGPGKGNARPKGSWPIPDPGCPAAVDWRPYGLGVKDGKVYVGGVCSGESTQRRADLSAHVLSVPEGGGEFTKVYSHTLDFKRGKVWASTPASDRWNPWSPTWNPSKFFVARNFNGSGIDEWNYPSPLLSDVEFDRDGSMILGFRDRAADQGGHRALSPETTGTSRDIRWSYDGTGGDINRVCRVGDAWRWEGEAGCANNAAGRSQPPQDGDVVEFYSGDYWAPSGQRTGVHGEVAQGALSFAPRFVETATTVLDPGSTISAGVGYFDNISGAYNSDPQRYYRLFLSPAAWEDNGAGGWIKNVPGQNGTFGKANGLGDLEMLADPAPLQLGDRVWFDANGDGVQDPAEPGLPGVQVILSCPDRAPIKTTTGLNGWYGLRDVPTHSTCGVTFNAANADTSALPGRPLSSTLTPSPARQGGDSRLDSNADETGHATVTTGAPGENDHTIDAGFTVRQQVPVKTSDLSINVEAVGQPACYCGPADLLVKVVNRGDGDATHIKLAAALPSGATLRPGTAWTASGDVALATYDGPLKPGQSLELPLKVDVPCADANRAELALSVSVYAFDDGEGLPLSDSNVMNNSAELVLKLCAKPNAPTYDVTVDFPKDTVTQCKGRWVCSDLIVRNNSAEPVRDVKVGVPVPDGLKFWPQHNKSWTAVDGKIWTTVAGPIAPGESVKVKLALRVACAAVPGSSHVLVATVDSFTDASGSMVADANPADNSDSTTIKIGRGAVPKPCG